MFVKYHAFVYPGGWMIYYVTRVLTVIQLTCYPFRNIEWGQLLSEHQRVIRRKASLRWKSRKRRKEATPSLCTESVASNKIWDPHAIRWYFSIVPELHSLPGWTLTVLCRQIIRVGSKRMVLSYGASLHIFLFTKDMKCKKCRPRLV